MQELENSSGFKKVFKFTTELVSVTNSPEYSIYLFEPHDNDPIYWGAQFCLGNKILFTQDESRTSLPLMIQSQIDLLIEVKKFIENK